MAHDLVKGSTASNSHLDAAQSARRLNSWKPNYTSARETTGLDLLRRRARHAYDNNPIARGLIDFLVTNIVGNGISPQPTIKSVRLRKQIVNLWERWGEQADFGDACDVYGLQTLAVRTFLVQGEAFVIHRFYETDSGVTYQAQVLEPEFVPMIDRVLDNGGAIRQGIEFDGNGKIVAYWVLSGMGAFERNTPQRVEAKYVSHVFEQKRAGQLRGIPALGVALVRIKNADDLDDAVLERQKIANLFVTFITRPAHLDEMEPYTPSESAQESAPDVLEGDMLPPIVMEPGISQVLDEGEDVKFSDPPDAGTNYVDYMRWQYRTICSGLGVPYAVFFNDFHEANDRTVRVALNEFSRRITQLVENTVVHKFCRPMRKHFFDAAILAGLLPSNKVEIRDTRWVQQAKPYIHPVQDIQSIKLRYELGLITRAEAALQLGKDVDLLDEEFAQDIVREQKLGLNFHKNIVRENSQGADDAPSAQ